MLKLFTYSILLLIISISCETKKTGGTLINTDSITQVQLNDSLRAIKDCDLLPDIHSANGFSISISESRELNRYKWISQKNYDYDKSSTSDSLEREFIKHYNKDFKHEKNYYSFKGEFNDSVTIWHHEGPGNDYQNFKLMTYADGFVVFLQMLYEDEYFVVFNTKTRRAFMLSGYPILSPDQRYLYSISGNTYEEGIVSVVDLEKKKDIQLIFKGWDILGHNYLSPNSVTLKIRSYRCEQITRYINLRFTNY